MKIRKFRKGEKPVYMVGIMVLVIMFIVVILTSTSGMFDQGLTQLNNTLTP